MPILVCSRCKAEGHTEDGLCPWKDMKGAMNPCSHFGNGRPIPVVCPCNPSCLCRSHTLGSCYKKNFDAVQHPSHYNQGSVECIDALEAATVGLTGIEAVCTSNAIKYLWRWKQRNGIEDLRKSLWYINHLIEKLKEKPARMQQKDSPTFYPVTCSTPPGLKCVRCGIIVSELNSNEWCRRCFEGLGRG